MRTHIFVRTHRFLQNNIFPLPRVAGGDVVGLDQEVGDLLSGALQRGDDLAALDAIFDQLSFQQFTEHTISDKDRLRKELAEARRNGYAFDSEELEAGLCCYAAPIFDYTNYPTAAISVSGPCFRMEGSLRSEIIPALQRSAQQITDLLVQSHYISSRNAG